MIGTVIAYVEAHPVLISVIVTVFLGLASAIGFFIKLHYGKGKGKKVNSTDKSQNQGRQGGVSIQAGGKVEIGGDVVGRDFTKRN